MIGLDHISIGIVGSIAIGLDHILIGVDSGFDGGFNGGFKGGLFNQFHLALLGYQPQQVFDSSDKRILGLSVKRVLWAIIIVTNTLIED